MAALLIAVAESKAQGDTPATSPRQPEARTAVVRRIVVSIPDRKLAVIENGKVVKIYRVGVGAKDSPSPSGEFKIINRIQKPTYYAPGVEIPAGEDNPLGPRWIGLSLSHFGIHGTNQPRSIGRYASHGCIRMRNADVEELFERVRVGDAIVLAGERTEEIAQIFGGAPVVVLTAAERSEDPKQPGATASTEGAAEQKALATGQEQ
ncbi:MAG TPA: L,D-transpeptidase [Candidatus Acidoferrales bacterium]|nr:L,D-transpeptidase [Candidatus Acidoferrales bacterium]